MEKAQNISTDAWFERENNIDYTPSSFLVHPYLSLFFFAKGTKDYA